MSMLLYWEKQTLNFLKPARTSRGAYAEKPVWLVYLTRDGIRGCGEAAPLPDLSIDGQADLDSVLTQLQYFAGDGLPLPELLRLTEDYPSLHFALECAALDLEGGGRGVLFDTPFTRAETSLRINGLVWMDRAEAMLEEALKKMDAGFSCLKFKVGALDPDEECRLLEKVRKLKNAFQLEIRLDANGAWPAADALYHLKEFSRFEIHSLEQPIKAGQHEAMAEVCAKSPIPVALDEELIGFDSGRAPELIRRIRPAYIILKPTMLGGFSRSDQWIAAAKQEALGWWSTSALEGNIGLSAIAQWASSKHPDMPQGLGTGALYANNFPARTGLKGEQLYFIP